MPTVSEGRGLRKALDDLIRQRPGLERAAYVALPKLMNFPILLAIDQLELLANATARLFQLSAGGTRIGDTEHQIPANFGN